MSVDKFISKHLSSPKGVSGKVVSFFMNRKNRPMYAETIRLLSLAGTENILDVGCGNGYVLNMIAKEYDGDFTGIDLSESIIKAAIRRNHLYVDKGKMKFVCQDLRAMSFDDECFSRIYTINTVYFWDNLESVMAEINRILQPNGIFVNTMYSNAALDKFSFTRFGYKKFTEQELSKAGIEAGFSVEKVPILNGAAYSYIYKNINKTT